LDAVTQARYAALFASYGETGALGGDALLPATRQAKEVIVDHIRENGPILGADAALLLISTFDNMIARPFTDSQSITSPSAAGYYDLLAPGGVAADELSAPQREDVNVRESAISDLRQLLDRLAARGRPVTARDVVVGINELWDGSKFAAFGKWSNPPL
jgi:hypothetical protein